MWIGVVLFAVVHLIALSQESSLFHHSTNHLAQQQRLSTQKEAIHGSIICPECSEIGCLHKKASKMKCKGGVVLDFCDCCQVCAKVEHEHCGGKWNFLGKCDKGLQCELSQPGTALDLVAPEHGLCKKAITPAFENWTPADEALKETTKDDVCEPKCTPDFCGQNPRAICSAINNADQSKSCQQTCQHTSCLACRFMDPHPEPCPKCAKDDFRCIRQYGRCIRKQSCRRRKFPCVKGLLKKEVGKFQCLVPDCPSRT